mmetsp:Transcript_5054/g.15768  ORF Transcript_5054/g.15768 Transcript_5054/m.15768 type:complete len:186 (-) Transcript_5054:67-624(-)
MVRAIRQLLLLLLVLVGAPMGLGFGGPALLRATRRGAPPPSHPVLPRFKANNAACMVLQPMGKYVPSKAPWVALACTACVAALNMPKIAILIRALLTAEAAPLLALLGVLTALFNLAKADLDKARADFTEGLARDRADFKEALACDRADFHKRLELDRETNRRDHDRYELALYRALGSSTPSASQ